jgi:hypothetical protein
MTSCSRLGGDSVEPSSEVDVVSGRVTISGVRGGGETRWVAGIAGALSGGGLVFGPDAGGLGLLLAGCVEELDAFGDHLELLTAAVVAVPLGVVQTPVDGDAPSVAQMRGARLGLAAEHGDVNEVGALVVAVRGRRRNARRKLVIWVPPLVATATGGWSGGR